LYPGGESSISQQHILSAFDPLVTAIIDFSLRKRKMTQSRYDKNVFMYLIPDRVASDMTINMLITSHVRDAAISRQFTFDVKGSRIAQRLTYEVFRGSTPPYNPDRYGT
jgi:hypothetical protein